MNGFLVSLRGVPTWCTHFQKVVLLLVMISMARLAFPQAKSPTNPPIPKTPGWHEIAGTQLASQCPKDPAIAGNTGCAAVINAWNGAAADIQTNRLLLWGGGHGDYFGNEVYALDLNMLTLSRLTEPSVPANLNACAEAYSDGRPAARHTYNGLAFLLREHSLFVYGGSKAPCGSMSDATWTFDLNALKWDLAEVSAGDHPANAPGVMTDYDPESGIVFLSDTSRFFQFDPQTHHYKLLNSSAQVDYHLTGVLDPQRHLFFMVGGPGQFWAMDVRPGSRFALQDWSKKAQGCEALQHSNSPGLAYDARLKQIVGWAGGDSVYIFDPETRRCTAETHPGGPGAAQPNGTFGRFRYFPEMDLFALVNDWKRNAFVLRLSGPNPVAAPPTKQ